jgi:hypothetical protein
MKRVLFALSLMAAAAFAGSPAEATLRVVKGEGWAPISGNATAAARERALAAALYDAASRLQTKVRGASQLNTHGRLTEEMTATVAAQLKGYEIIKDGQMGSNWMIVVEAIGEAENEGPCDPNRRVDLDMRHVSIRVAPGIQGHANAAIHEGMARGVEALATGGTYVVSDQRFLPPLRGAERNHASSLDYMTQVSGALPSPSGYSLSGTIIAEIDRGDYYIAQKTAINVSISLKLRDNFNGVTIANIQEQQIIPGTTTVYGLPRSGFDNHPKVNIAPLFQKVQAALDSVLACKPLRAVVIAKNNGKLVLSAGLDNGVQPGDYFLVNGKGRESWQILKIEDASAGRAIARPIRPGRQVPVNSLVEMLL